MFGVGAPEFFAILVIALIVLGPERLPVAMRTVGRWVRRLRDMSREFREEFADEFKMIYEEVDVLRREAEATRSELQEIRRELQDTVQEAADDVNAAGKEMLGDVEGALKIGGPAPSAPTGGAGSENGEPVAPLGRTGVGDLPEAERAALGPADRMALAIADTFSTNGVAEDVAAVDGQALAPPVQRLEAYAPDVAGPVEAEPSMSSTPAPDPLVYHVVAEPGGPAEPLLAAGIGAAEPTLHNQMGGFMRLIIMKALEDDPDFRLQAETTLRAQAPLDAARAAEIEEPTMLDIAEAWAQQRRQLVPHGSVTVEQKAPQSAVIELFECPYRLASGDAHPVCDVSNVYDDAYFAQFDAKATYVQRMSDGADHCQLVVVANERLKRFGVRVEGEPAEAGDGAESEPADQPVSGST